MIEIKGVEVGGFQLLHSEIRKYGFQILLSGNSWKLLPTGTKEQTYIWETPSYALLHPSSLFHGQRTDTVGCPWSDAWGTPSHGLENAGQPTSTFVPRDHPTCLRLVWKKRLIMREHLGKQEVSAFTLCCHPRTEVRPLWVKDVPDACRQVLACPCKQDYLKRFIYIYLKGIVRESKREREIFHSLVQSPNGCNSHNWTSLKASSGLPMWAQGPKYMDYPLLHSQVH